LKKRLEEAGSSILKILYFLIDPGSNAESDVEDNEQHLKVTLLDNMDVQKVKS
jgi:hypothetical protein